MTKQEWVKEIIAEGIVAAIARFKEEKPYTLHQLATDIAREIQYDLHLAGVVIKAERELPSLLHPTYYKAGIESDADLATFARVIELEVKTNVLESGYVATIPLIEEGK